MLPRVQGRRDEARGDLCLARRRARKLAAILSRAADGLLAINAVTWTATDGIPVFHHPNARDAGAPLPGAPKILDVLQTIADCEKTIAEYDEFVR